MRHDLRQEPYAVTLHVRICAGGGQQWPSLPRPLQWIESARRHFSSPGQLNDGTDLTVVRELWSPPVSTPPVSDISIALTAVIGLISHPSQLRTLEHYSSRKATKGSIRDARRAGR